MKQADCYPHKVGEIDVMETHISWLILTGEYAYKIKKSVKFDFLDFSSLHKREFFCNEELRLNRRFASGIYLDVVPITRSKKRISVKGEGEILEYAVLMKQFPKNQLISELAASGKLEEEIVCKIADALCDFHREAQYSKTSKSRYLRSTLGLFLGNLQTLQEMTAINDTEWQCLDQIKAWTSKSLEHLTPVLFERYKCRMIKSCHGDLHLGNITLLDNKPVFFDCIEFNADLENIDTISELAFLIMDLSVQGLEAESNRLLNRYLSGTGDYFGLRIVRFYLVYRALIRAKVYKLRLAQPNLDDHEKNICYLTYKKYLDYAANQIHNTKNTLLITFGLSGSGKTTKSERIAKHMNAVHIRSDVERKRIFGLQKEARSGSEPGEGLYSSASNDQTYKKLYALCESSLEGGFNTIVDATFMRKTDRDMFKELALKHGVNFKIIYCQASASELQVRLLRRSQNTTVSEADAKVLKWQQERLNPLTEVEMKYLMTSNEI